eukprot:gene14077-16593_t
MFSSDEEFEDEVPEILRTTKKKKERDERRNDDKRRRRNKRKEIDERGDARKGEKQQITLINEQPVAQCAITQSALSGCKASLWRNCSTPHRHTLIFFSPLFFLSGARKDAKAIANRSMVKETRVKVDALERANPECEGFLTKEGGSVKSWKKRWFILKGKKIYYFKYKGDQYCKGFIDLEDSSSVRTVGTKEFHIVTAKRVFPLKSETPNDAKFWIESINKNLTAMRAPVIAVAQPQLTPGTTFQTAQIGEVTVRLISGKNLVAADVNGTSDPYCKIRSQGYPTALLSKCIQKNLNPVWNQNMHIKLANVLTDIIHFEVYDKDALGKDDMIGYFGVDASLLPMGVEVVTSEKLSYVPHGEIQIGLTAVNFGLQGYQPSYPMDYIAFRGRLPPVSKKGMDKEKKKVKKVAKTAGKKQKEEGPYVGKTVHQFYEVVNGYLKKKPTRAAVAGESALNLVKGTGRVLGKVGSAVIDVSVSSDE